MEKDNNHQKPATQNDMTLKDISIFENDPYFVFIYKKAEKIAAAIYMITDFFDDREPLKLNIRKAALSLIDLTLSLNTTLSPERKSLLNHITRHSLSIISYSEIAARAGIESLMNHRILKDEIQNFIKTIEDREVPQKLGRHFVLNDDFIKDENAEFMKPVVNHTGLPYQPTIHNPSSHLAHQSIVFKKPISQGGPSIKEERSVAIKKEDKGSRKSERQEAIISVIRQKGELSIKDLTGVIKGCSEKTIQRELLVLVDMGILNKAGERRWSRYSLIN